jgi:hypothetical protein
MNQNIDINFLVIMLTELPAKYNTPTIQVAKGKYKLPTTFKGIIKKIINS